MANKGAYLTNGQYLSNDDYLVSDNNQFVAVMQDDGNFVLYYATTTSPPNPDFSRPYWSCGANAVKNYSGVAHGGQYIAMMQSDGNFVLYNGSDPAHLGTPYWATNTNQSPPSQYFAIIQDDANFVVYRGTPSISGTPVWDTKTNLATQGAQGATGFGTSGVARTGSGSVIPPPPAPEAGQTLQSITQGDPRFDKQVFVQMNQREYPGKLMEILRYSNGQTIEYFSVSLVNPSRPLPARWFTSDQVKFV